MSIVIRNNLYSKTKLYIKFLILRTLYFYSRKQNITYTVHHFMTTPPPTPTVVDAVMSSNHLRTSFASDRRLTPKPSRINVDIV